VEGSSRWRVFSGDPSTADAKAYPHARGGTKVKIGKVGRVCGLW